eukprot:gnl/MRDRNA2_/MRDRNA2_19545_c0_seq1.p1 gnl/MRDRNA2_/MRDRNA2_19545_c0~~gnl/MRDRNA2_/MRDRNA2_19545_c0_seq1.p1  ORF type:complete len:528 (+),score=103.73 gnl/MRDRNA2_/MRDRNA2_19545_c0_seq1:319-1902(+)
MFVEEFKKQFGTWIMKPVGKSQGKGIFLVNKLSQISDWRQDPKWRKDEKKEEEEKMRKCRMRRSRMREDEKRQAEEDEEKEAEPYVVQKYLSDPLLIGGKKFDLRLYVLVTSYAPLVVYMYRSGFARFSHTRFSMNSSDLSNAAVHLTNVSVQKNCDKYDERRGGKWDLHHLKLYLISKEGLHKVNEMFCEIQNIVLFSLFSVQKSMIQDKHCFELYGYDIMISETLKPWLIEVNAQPSLTATTSLDYELKYSLLDDTLTVLDLENYLNGDEEQLGGFDLLYKNGVRVGPPPSAAYQSYLGCYNNRGVQLRRLWENLQQDTDTAAQKAQQSSSNSGWGNGASIPDTSQQEKSAAKSASFPASKHISSTTNASQREWPGEIRDPFEAKRRMAQQSSSIPVAKNSTSAHGSLRERPREKTDPFEAYRRMARQSSSYPASKSMSSTADSTEFPEIEKASIESVASTESTESFEIEKMSIGSRASTQDTSQREGPGEKRDPFEAYRRMAKDFYTRQERITANENCGDMASE